MSKAHRNLTPRTLQEINSLLHNQVIPAVKYQGRIRVDAQLIDRPSAPFVSSVRVTPQTATVLLPTTSSIRDRSSMNSVIEGIMVDPREKPMLQQWRAMSTDQLTLIHSWSDRRLGFALGHEVGHLVNQDYSLMKSITGYITPFMAKILATFASGFAERSSPLQSWQDPGTTVPSSRMPRGKEYIMCTIHPYHRREVKADAVSAAAGKEFCLGGIEHLTKLAYFYDMIDRAMVRMGHAQLANAQTAHRLQTHPAMGMRLERLIDGAMHQYNMSVVEAIRAAVGGGECDGQGDRSLSWGVKSNSTDLNGVGGTAGGGMSGSGQSGKKKWTSGESQESLTRSGNQGGKRNLSTSSSSPSSSPSSGNLEEITRMMMKHNQAGQRGQSKYTLTEAEAMHPPLQKFLADYLRQELRLTEEVHGKLIAC